MLIPQPYGTLCPIYSICRMRIIDICMQLQEFNKIKSNDVSAWYDGREKENPLFLNMHRY